MYDFDLAAVGVVCTIIGFILGAVFYWAVQRATLNMFKNHKQE